MTTILGTLLAVATLMVHGSAVSGERMGPRQQQPPPIDGPVNDHGRAMLTGTEIGIELDDFYFEPTDIETPAGRTFTARLHNSGTVSHTFTIPELGIDEVLGPGERREVQMTMPDQEQVVFVCTFHEPRGMKGQFYT